MRDAQQRLPLTLEARRARALGAAAQLTRLWRGKRAAGGERAGQRDEHAAARHSPAKDPSSPGHERFILELLVQPACTRALALHWRQIGEIRRRVLFWRSEAA
jgi:hypothetical protein